MEFLTEVLLTVPPGTPADEVARRRAAEAARARELAGQGHLLRLWRPAEDGLSVSIRSLGTHPSDPG